MSAPSIYAVAFLEAMRELGIEPMDVVNPALAAAGQSGKSAVTLAEIREGKLSHVLLMSLASQAIDLAENIPTRELAVISAKEAEPLLHLDEGSSPAPSLYYAALEMARQSERATPEDQAQIAYHLMAERKYTGYQGLWLLQLVLRKDIDALGFLYALQLLMGFYGVKYTDMLD